jgi:hypothetical protein
MIGRIRKRISSAHVIAALALFIALGTSAAFALPGKNTVNSGDVKNGTLKSADAKDGGLKGVDLKDGTVGGADLTDGSVGSADITDGSVGSADITDGSVTGTDVQDGSLSASDLNQAGLGSTLDVTYAINFNHCTVAEGTQGSCTATCPAGLNAVGGGTVAEGNFAEHVEINGSRPDPAQAAATGWKGFVDNNADLGGANNNDNVTTYATCAKTRSADTISVSG